MTDQPRQLGIARSYEELHSLLRERVAELDVSRLTLDDAAGLTEGHSSKLLSPRPIKILGKVSLGSVLGALGCALVVIEDVEALARISPKLVKRQVRRRTMLAYKWGRGLGTTRRQVSERFVRKIARDGGNARARNLTPAQRSRIARQAATVRWDGARPDDGAAHFYENA
jgi:hypothetical protein